MLDGSFSNADSEPGWDIFIKWSATRKAWAAIVSAGFIAAEDGKKDESTTYKFSIS
jgi:hypothetical protein